jgi:hypothetical protein
MAVNIEQELRTQLAAVDDKLAALGELQAQKAKLEATLKFLTGEISLDDVKQKRGVKGGGTRGPQPPMQKAKIALSKMKKKAAAEPKNAELQRKVKDLEALIVSLGKK